MQKKTALACSQCGSRNYTTVVHGSQSARIELKKFCKHCQTHTIHRETK
ncbi:50S ribosomal protein L33 [Heyndrickxia acidiproducens]|nr:50S ribosomal protein L33 [Heyndrickxia acidiproducens]